MDATDVNPWGKPDKKSKKLVTHAPSRRFSKKMSQNFVKTKVVAASGVKKIKSGASAGINWLKIKYQAHKLAKTNK